MPSVPEGPAGPATRTSRGGFLHLMLGGAVLCGCLVMPRAGRESLLVPLGAASPLAGLQSIAPGARVVRSGVPARSVIVHFPGEVPFLPLLRARVIAVAVPAFLCADGQGGGASASIASVSPPARFLLPSPVQPYPIQPGRQSASSEGLVT